MNVSDFDFDLPEGLIAQVPTAERGAGPLLAGQKLDRAHQPVKAVGDCGLEGGRSFVHQAQQLGELQCLLHRGFVSPHTDNRKRVSPPTT